MISIEMLGVARLERLRPSLQLHGQLPGPPCTSPRSSPNITSVGIVASVAICSADRSGHDHRTRKLVWSRTVPSAARNSTFHSPARSGLIVVPLNVR